MAARRICVDGLRLSRGTLAQRVAQYQLAVRNHRYLRVSQGLVLLLPILVDRPAGAAPVSALELAWDGRQGDCGLGLLESRQGRTGFQRPESWHERCEEGFARCMECEVRCGHSRRARL